MSYFDQQGKPLSREAGAALFSDERNAERVVARDQVGEADVSTVHLVIDHGFGGVPLIFETMIFGGDHDGFQDRYSTRQEAEAGHRRVVERLRAGNSPDPSTGRDDR